MERLSLKDFADLIGLSERTIRRYIVKGQAPNGSDFKPAKIQGRYIFTKADIGLFAPDKANLSELSGQIREIDKARRPAKSGEIDAKALLDRLLTAEREIGHLKALSAFNEALQSDFDRLNAAYIEAQAERKAAVDRLNEVKAELDSIKSRSIWQRLFKKRE